jgi:hypothetical protein
LNRDSGGLTFGDGIIAARIRIARPTDRLDEVVAFYRDGLGLPELYRFTGHDGYDGVMIGLVLPMKPWAVLALFKSPPANRRHAGVGEDCTV